MPELSGENTQSDFYFIDRDEPEQIADTLVDMVKTRVPARLRFDPIRDIQVLCR
jgi:exodeoxyribonuclease V alpha subunit